MKKIRLLLVCVLLISLCACSAAEVKYTIERNGKSYEIDTENGTIFDGTDTYEYTFSGNSSAYSISIRYPNGASYQMSKASGDSIAVGSGAGDYVYVLNHYASGGTLCEVLLEKAPRKAGSGDWLQGIVLAAIGLFVSAFPYAAWYLEYGWRYKDAEPSDFVLGLNRAGGIVMIIAAVAMMIL